jgi:guanylate kinase
MIVKNLSNIGRSADGTKHVYLAVSLTGYGLKDIRALVKYKDLQNIELSHNQLKDLSVLSDLPYMLSLTVSHNDIEKLFDFLPPYNLKEASFSFNKIKEIGNLSNFHYLQSLELNNNRIERIEGLEYCHRLKNLNLAHNLIKKIEGLDNLPLVNLDLRSNQIKKIDGLQTLKFLRSLNLSGNNIKSLNGLVTKRHEFLETIDLENNNISDLTEIENITHLNLLRELNFLSNPIREIEDYRLLIIFKIPKLTVLDRSKVLSKEKVNSNSLFSPTAEYIASRDHITNFIFNAMQDHKVKESTLPSFDSPYPILILCGPVGSGSTDIARKLAEEYPDYFEYIIPFTTRKPKDKNNEAKEPFNFIRMKDFESDVTHGKFICCHEYSGDWYGIQWDSIESVARRGLACVIQMELESLLSFKQTYFEPRCVLVLSLDENIQKERLKLENNCSEKECEVAVERTSWFAQYNRDHPGFFDSVVITDDINEAYKNLSALVLNYLGISNLQDDNINNNNIKESQEMKQQMDDFDKEFPGPRPGNLSLFF